MTRSTRQLLVLAIVAVALVAAVLWVGRRAYLNDPSTLTPIAADTVTHIQLDIPPIASQVFARRSDGWWRIKPSAARGDAERIERLANLAGSPVARWIPASEVTPAKVGLAQPSATLVVNGTRLAYGGMTALGDFRYVEVGDRVALVPRQYSPEVMLQKPAGD